MGNAGTLGNTAGARSVHDAIQIGALGWNRVYRILLTKFQHILVRDDLDVRVLLLKVIDFVSSTEDALSVDNDSLNLGGFQRTSGKRGQQMGIGVHDLALGLSERVLDAVGAQSIVRSGDGNGLRSARMRCRNPAHTK